MTKPDDDTQAELDQALAKAKTERDAALVSDIEASIRSGKPVDAHLDTDERVLARVTDGIYRQPSSALRELIANAYDADAQTVSIATDAPRFKEITITDDGIGMGPEALANLIHHIGGSAKRTPRGVSLHVTNPSDSQLSPSGRRLIGKIGIGLFSVAQLTRQFLIITKVKGADHKLFAHVTLNRFDETELTRETKDGAHRFRAGEVRIWAERTPDKKGHGTTIQLTTLLPRVVHILQNRDAWRVIEEESSKKGRPAPLYHIGRLAPDNTGSLLAPASLPWSVRTSATKRLAALVEKVAVSWKQSAHYSRLEHVCDNYFQSLWSLGLSLPVPYVDKHPFDLRSDAVSAVYKLPERITKKPLEQVDLDGKKIGDVLGLDASSDSARDFVVEVDGTVLSRPVRFHGYPVTDQALQGPILFVGKASPDLSKIPPSQRGGELSFSAYFFWTPRLIPHEHRGVLVRINGASGTLFDPSFFKYQVGERRLGQFMGEIFVHKGLDGALNIDRESFNTAHPHYQMLSSWVHNCLRLMRNTVKALQAEALAKKRKRKGAIAERELMTKVNDWIAEHTDFDPEDVPDVFIAANERELETAQDAGKIVFLRRELTDRMGTVTWSDGHIAAIARLLESFELLNELDRPQQADLISGILRALL